LRQRGETDLEKLPKVNRSSKLIGSITNAARKKKLIVTNYKHKYTEIISIVQPTRLNVFSIYLFL
jgi:hypothetical protein